MGLAERLAAIAAEYTLPASAAVRFEALLAALASEADPPTTIREPTAAADHHIADSLTALQVPAVRAAAALVDIGSGAGFPGLPLAVALPGAQVDLVESARRKCAVIERLASAAEVENIRALPVRAEEWAASEGRPAYDVVTARAVASLPVLVEYAAPLLRLGGTFVAWKGARDAAEEAAGARAAEMLGLRTFEVLQVQPFPGARDLNLHLYLKERETPNRFPRRIGVAGKRPLA
jgi:16S rRNA (guanine527-N7)-methyltransferase